MNKKILLGVGSLAAAALPVSVVVACNNDDKDKTTPVAKKTAVVTVASPAKVAATVAGTGNEYTLAVVNTDTINKTELETAFKGMVAKATTDTETPTFAGTWDTDFDGTKNATYTYTLKAEGYTDVTFAVTVTGNAAVNGVITLNANAALHTVTITGTTTPYAVTLPNGTAVTTDDVKALFGGQGMLAVADTDTYNATTPAAYTFTITDPGLNGGTPATATLEVTVAAPAPVNGAITLNTGAKLKGVTITGTTTPYAVTLPNGTAVTTDDVKALFGGQGMLTVANTDTYNATTPAAYTFAITDPGLHGGTATTATLEVTVQAAPTDLTAEIAKLGDFTSADTSQKVGNVFATTDAVGADVKAKFVAITEVAAAIGNTPTVGNGKPLTAALMNGVTIDTVVVQTVLDKTTTGGKLVVTVTLKKGTDTVENNSKDITITFA